MVAGRARRVWPRFPSRLSLLAVLILVITGIVAGLVPPAEIHSQSDSNPSISFVLWKVTFQAITNVRPSDGYYLDNLPLDQRVFGWNHSIEHFGNGFDASISVTVDAPRKLTTEQLYTLNISSATALTTTNYSYDITGTNSLEWSARVGDRRSADLVYGSQIPVKNTSVTFPPLTLNNTTQPLDYSPYWQNGVSIDIRAQVYTTDGSAHLGATISFIYVQDPNTVTMTPTPSPSPSPTATAVRPPKLDISPTSVSRFSNPGNRIPLTLPITLTLSLTGPAKWQTVTTTQNNGNWLSVEPSVGSLEIGAPTVVTATIDSRSLVTGTYQGAIGFVLSDFPATQPVTVTVDLTVIPKPIVFVPGVAGSTLIDRASNDYKWWVCCVFGDPWPITLWPTDTRRVNVLAGDAARSGYGSDIYGKFLTFLGAQGFVEYQVNNTPNRRTLAGCDLTQQSRKPNLFVFGYDWRQDNVQNAASLADYVRCIERFYPGTHVTLVAHSMGNLVARRYVLDYPNDHQVEAHIAIAPPWLGAVAPVYSYQSGDWLTTLISTKAFKNMARSWPGPFTLTPSASFFALGGRPVAKDNWDIDGGGTLTGTLTFNQQILALDRLFGTPANKWYPGQTNQAFHGYQNNAQDDFRRDDPNRGVQYFILAGQEKTNTTLQQVTFRRATVCTIALIGLNCRTEEQTVTAKGPGDGTVPILSSLRRGNGQDLNGPSTTVFPPFTQGDVSHVNLPANPVVEQTVMQIHRSINAPPASANALSIAIQPQQTITTTPAVYLSIFGTQSLTVTGGVGNSIISASGRLTGTIPGVLVELIGDTTTGMVLPQGLAYTVAFQTTGQAVTIDGAQGTGEQTAAITRWRDIPLPAGTIATLAVAGNGALTLSYKDGSVTRTIPPTAQATGAAVDLNPPSVQVSQVLSGSLIALSLSASDVGSGIAGLWYSLDGTSFRPYTGTLALDARAVPVLYAFADDKQANRSGLLTIPAGPRQVYVPVAVRGFGGG